MRYLIIGNGIAAAGCVEGIRSVDKTGPITLLSAELHPVYSRPLISYLLLGKTSPDHMGYRPASFYEDNGAAVRYGVRAEAIDAAAHMVRGSDGARYPYDKLLVAAGSRPFVPPAEGMEGVAKRFTFLTLDDAEALGAAVHPSTRVLIVGAGLIGLKCAEGICGRAGSVTVLDLAPRILPSILEAEPAALVQAHLERAMGLKFVLGDSVKSYAAVPHGGYEAVTAAGRRIPFDVLVTAVGVRANTALVAEAGGEVARGIVTDDAGRTTLEDVFAAGDCAESFDITTGTRRVLALLPNAYLQGHAAGVTMAGGEERFTTAMPMNAIGFAGLHILTAGAYTGERRLRRGPESYRALYVEGGRLVGFVLIGETARAGIYTALIREKTPLDGVDFDAMFDTPQLAALPALLRAEKLANR